MLELVQSLWGLVWGVVLSVWDLAWVLLNGALDLLLVLHNDAPRLEGLAVGVGQEYMRFKAKQFARAITSRNSLHSPQYTFPRSWGWAFIRQRISKPTSIPTKAWMSWTL